MSKLSKIMNDCVFCNIIARHIPSSIIAETDQLIVIKDITPKATLHYLIIPKEHVKDIQSLKEKELNLASRIFEMAQKLSHAPEAKDFKLVINSGHNAGQRVYHLHAHFLAGQYNLKEL